MTSNKLSVILFGARLTKLLFTIQVRESRTIFLLTGLPIYTGEYKAQGPTLCPTEGRASRGPRALDSPV